MSLKIRKSHSNLATEIISVGGFGKYFEKNRSQFKVLIYQKI
jgi:hypothetical protein